MRLDRRAPPPPGQSVPRSPEKGPGRGFIASHSGVGHLQDGAYTVPAGAGEEKEGERESDEYEYLRYRIIQAVL